MANENSNKKRKEKDIDLFKGERYTTYSSLDFRKVLKFLNLSDILFGQDDCFALKDVSEDTVDFIVKYLRRATMAEGHVDTGLEPKREDFISAILINIIADYYNSGLRLEREYIIDGEETNGKVGYVTVKDLVVLLVVEAKAERWDQGRAQNLMQVYNSYKNNLNNGKAKNHTVYGAITTGHTWEFISCRGNDKDDNLEWKHMAKIIPLETDLRKSEEDWKNKLLPLLKVLSNILYEGSN